jgi:hypothetical protein
MSFNGHTSPIEKKITNLRYESKRCWANLAELYLEEASLPIRMEIFTIRDLTGSRLGIG